MDTNDGDRLNRIEELKSKLFSKNYKTKIQHRDRFTRPIRTDIPEVWENGKKMVSGVSQSTTKFFMEGSMFKKFFIFSLGFFSLTLIYAGYIFFGGGNTVSNDKIDISITGNNFAAGGEDLSLVISITNRNSTPIDLVDLVVEYPKTSSGTGTDFSTGNERQRITIGTIPAGAVRNENLKMVLFGEQGSVRPIRIYMEYRVQGSNAIFIKEKSYEVTINSTPLNLSIDAPLSISPNQEITLKVKASLNATKPLSKIILKLDYPPGFQFTSSLPTPTLGNDIWSLGDLAPGAEQNITVVGKMIDVFDGEEKTFRVIGGKQSSTDKSVVDSVLNSLVHTVVINKPSIEANLSINGFSKTEYAIDASTPMSGQIFWTNNSSTKINDLVIKAKISGNAVNRKTINAQRGFYDSSKDLITWDKNSINSFTEVSPGDSGTVDFSISPLSLFSGSGGVLSDPSIKIEISITGKQLVEGYATNDVSSSDSSTIRIISDVGFSAKGLYYSGAFTNKGSIPPKVERETTYTIVWSLSNASNSISKAVIRATLPAWINFVGTISPANEDIKYNSSTKEIVWNIGTIPKGTGITGAGRTASFQVSFSPSLSQVGTSPVIINSAVLTGHDDFANVDVKASKISLNTNLENDPQFPSNGGVVVE